MGYTFSVYIRDKDVLMLLKLGYNPNEWIKFVIQRELEKLRKELEEKEKEEKLY